MAVNLKAELEASKSLVELLPGLRIARDGFIKMLACPFRMRFVAFSATMERRRGCTQLLL